MYITVTLTKIYQNQKENARGVVGASPNILDAHMSIPHEPTVIHSVIPTLTASPARAARGRCASSICTYGQRVASVA